MSSFTQETEAALKLMADKLKMEENKSQEDQIDFDDEFGGVGIKP